MKPGTYIVWFMLQRNDMRYASLLCATCEWIGLCFVFLLLFKGKKPSVCLSVRSCRAHNFAVSQCIDSRLARNESPVFCNQQVCFRKFLDAAVCRPGHSGCQNVEDFCLKFHLSTYL